MAPIGLTSGFNNPSTNNSIASFATACLSFDVSMLLELSSTRTISVVSVLSVCLPFTIRFIKNSSSSSEGSAYLLIQPSSISFSIGFGFLMSSFDCMNGSG